MKKFLFRFTLLTLVLAVLTATFASCSGSMSKMGKLVKNKKNVSDHEQKIVEIDFIKGNFVSSFLALLITSDYDYYYVYNLFKEKEIGRFPKTDATVSHLGSYPSSYYASTGSVFVVQDNEKMYLYNLNGDLIDESTTQKTIPSLINNAFLFNGIYYYADYDEVFEISPSIYSVISNCKYVGGRFYYTSGSNTICVYDKNGKILADYKSKTGKFSSVSILDNGNVLIQEILYVVDSEDYDFYFVESVDEQFKIKLFSYILDIKTGKAKEVKLDFFIDSNNIKNSIYPHTSPYQNNAKTFNGDNLLCVIRSKDKYIIPNISAYEYVIASNNLTELKYYNDIANDVQGITQINDNRYSVVTGSTKILMDKNAKQIGTINGYNAITNNYVVYSSTIHSATDLSLVYNFGKEGYTFYTAVGNSLFFTKTSGAINNVYIFSQLADGTFEFKRIGATETFYANHKGFYTNIIGQFTYYDENANVLLQTTEYQAWLFEYSYNGVFYAISKNYKLSYLE